MMSKDSILATDSAGEFYLGTKNDGATNLKMAWYPTQAASRKIDRSLNMPNVGCGEL